MTFSLLRMLIENILYLLEPSFSLFIQLYFVYDVQWSEDQFHIFVNVTRDKIMSPTVIVTMAVVR